MLRISAVVAICHNHYDDEIILFSRYADSVRMRTINKFYGNDREIHNYRIDWGSTKLEFYVNGYVVYMIDFDRHVPNQFMRIFAQMVPNEVERIPLVGSPPDEKLGSQTIIHRVRYIKFEEYSPPMKLRNRSSNVPIAILAGLFLIFWF